MDELLGWTKLLDYKLYVRGIIITLYAIFLFRAHSARLFGNHSPLDFIIYVILGAILGEAIVNNIPLLPSMVVCAFIVIMHRILAYLAFKDHRIGFYIKGEKKCLVKNGKYIHKHLKCCQVTPRDILQALRLQMSQEKITLVKEANLERDGQISFILKGKTQSSDTKTR